MGNNYSMEYGYPSLIYPARMFKTREDARQFDSAEAMATLTGFYITKERIRAIASGTIDESDEENCRLVLAALRWIVNAADDAESARLTKEWEAKHISTKKPAESGQDKANAN
jgi:hypothetical protein